MRHKYLIVLALISIINNVFAMQNSDKYKKETVLGRLVTNYPFSVLSGGYLITKDFVHAQLGECIPHVFVKTATSRQIFPPVGYSKAHIIHKTMIAQYGRYRNVGFALLLTAIARNVSYSRDGDMIKIDFMKQ